MTKRVAEIMVKGLQFIDSRATLHDAHKLMVARNIRHLLVHQAPNGSLLGILSDRDIKKCVSPFATASTATDRDKATLDIEVSKVMTKTVVTAKPDDKVQQVAETMLQKRISGIPVVDESGKAVGIVTSTDLMRLLISLL